MRGCRLALRLRQRRLRELHRFLRVADLLGRNRMLGEQRLAFGEVGRGARQFQLAGGDQRVVLAGGGFLLAHLAHRLRQRARGALQAGLGIDRIEAHQCLARFDELRVVGKHRDHGAGNLRGDHHLVAVHIGIIGAFALRQHQHPVRRPDQS